MPPAEPPHLLVLDDEPALGSVLCHIAQRCGWTSAAATTVAEFHALFRRGTPDLIMLDLKLGASDGIEQLRFLQEQRYGGAVVLMSGFEDRVLATSGEVGRSLGLAIVGTLSKPASNAEIRDLLTTLGRPSMTARRAPVAVGAHDGGDAVLSAAALDAALTAGELSLLFQPIVNCASGAVEVFEALARWHHPVRGVVMPDQFIPLGEQDIAVIDRLTQWVIRTAAAESCRLGRRALPATVAVNVSAKNLRALDFPDRLLDAVMALGAAPADMTLEITESAATGDPTITKDILTRLRLKGFRLAIDDFGTGFSSLKALLGSPFSELKIDKSFVQGLQTSRDARLIVKSVAHLAQDMGLRTVAEGAETKAIVDQLMDYGVDSVQGYYVGRPMPAADIPDWLLDRRSVA